MNINTVVIIFITIGFLFDFVSLIALIFSLFGKKSSGFLYVGFILYLVAAIIDLFANKNLIPLIFGLIAFHFSVNLTLKRIHKTHK